MRTWIVVSMVMGWLAGCGGGSSKPIERLCTKVCACFGDSGSPTSEPFDESACVTECVTDAESDPTFVPPPEACVDCVSDASCDALRSGACNSACGSSGS